MSRYDRARAEQRRAQAIAMRAAGHDYDAIAVQLGFSNRSGAWKAVQHGLKKNTADGVDDLRTVETERLDAMQVAVWDRALAGDVRAVMAALKIIQAGARLLGLVPDRKTTPISPAGRRRDRGPGRGAPLLPAA